VAAALALPILWLHGLTVAVAAVPLLRRRTHAVTASDWLSAFRPRALAGGLAVVVGCALIIAVLAPGAVRDLMDYASSNLQPYERTK
jgi:hypothetical protein